MGGGASRQYIVEEQRKPQDASDIPDGDFAAAKREVERLRFLLAQVDCGDLEATPDRKVEYKEERIPREEFKTLEPDEKKVSRDKGSLLESPEGHEYWSTLGQPLPRGNTTRVEKQEFGTDKTSNLESSEGASYWKGVEGMSSPKKNSVSSSPRRTVLNDEGHAIVPQLSKEEVEKVTLTNSLLDDIKCQIFSKTKTIEEAFLKLDKDKSGYISRLEFRRAMSEMGYFITDEEFDLINLTYPHHEKLGEEDKGISYLEFVTMLTGQLTYVPGFGESLRISDTDKVRATYLLNDENDDETHLWHSYLTDKRERESRLQHAFSKRVFEDFFTMKEAFNNIDKDRSGYIDLPELKEVLLTTFHISASDEEVADLMSKFDKDHDGKLAYHEFVKFLQVDDMLSDI